MWIIDWILTMRKTTTLSITYKKSITIKHDIINMLSLMGFETLKYCLLLIVL